MLGVSTGGRISELLSLRVGDVYQNKKPVSDLLYSKSIVKGGEVSRSVPVNADGRRAIDELVNRHRRHYGNPIASKRPLFPSRHKSGTVPMHRQTAHAILKTAFMEAGLNGTHRDAFTAEVLSHSVYTTRQATSIWCKSCLVTGTSAQHRSIWVSTMRTQRLPSKRLR